MAHLEMQSRKSASSSYIFYFLSSVAFLFESLPQGETAEKYTITIELEYVNRHTYA